MREPIQYHDVRLLQYNQYFIDYLGFVVLASVRMKYSTSSRNQRVVLRGTESSCSCDAPVTDVVKTVTALKQIQN